MQRPSELNEWQQPAAGPFLPFLPADLCLHQGTPRQILASAEVWWVYQGIHVESNFLLENRTSVRM